MAEKFQVGLTRDFLTADGQLTYQDIGIDILDAAPEIEYRFFDEHRPLVTPDQLRDFDAVISLTPRYTSESFVGVERLAAIVRFGVGFDFVDVPACDAADVLLCITTGAVNHSVAEATVTWMLALSHNMLIKDQLTREGRWGERSNYMGSELRDRTLGIVGLGGIGGRLVEVLAGFGMKPPIAFDPYASPERAEQLGVKLVPLDQLMREADFVSVNCPLNDETRNLIGKDQLALMKPTAYIINTARGGIVNEAALYEALKTRSIAGAATDVFEKEPVEAGHPLAELENVIVAPHSIAWTNELFRDIGRMACEITVKVARGEVPPGIVNREVLQQPGFQAKLEGYRKAHTS
jgi:phosphoglycerate dehydrogenase-like enzyme